MKLTVVHRAFLERFGARRIAANIAKLPALLKGER
jgi:hypothetical protein